jgi:hypothetical protein
MILGELRSLRESTAPHLRLADIVDHVEPVMLIVGSRGVGQLKGLVTQCTFVHNARFCPHFTPNTESFWARHRTT